MKKMYKPIHKCSGCGLNLKERCGIFEIPQDMWARGRCPGYMNEKLLREYEETQRQVHEKTPKEIRQEIFKQRKTVPHWQGHIASEVVKGS